MNKYVHHMAKELLLMAWNVYVVRFYLSWYSSTYTFEIWKNYIGVLWKLTS